MRRMKRTVRIVSLVLVLAVMLTFGTVFASAATIGATVFDITLVKSYANVSLKPQAYDASTDKTTTFSSFASAKVNGAATLSCVFEYVDKYTISFTPTTTEDDYMVFMLKVDDTIEFDDLADEEVEIVPNSTNIVYIDQKESAEKVTFDIYPADLEYGTYIIYVSSKSDQYTKIGYLGVADPAAVDFVDFKLGDTDLNGRIVTRDVQKLLEHIAHRTTLTGDNKLAGDVTGDGQLNTRDAQKLMQFLAKRISYFY